MSSPYVTRDHLYSPEYKAIAQSMEIGAEKGNADCVNLLGHFYEIGIGVPRDPLRAFSLYRSAAHACHAGAQSHLGQCFSMGKGCEVDYNEAFLWYTKSAAAQNCSGQYHLGYALLHGKGCEKNEKAAEVSLLQAAAQGVGSAHYVLGQMYRLGFQDQVVDPKRAKRHFETGSAMKNGDCTEVLGNFIGTGEFQQPDHLAAMRLYELAALQGNPKGYFHVALMYQYGCGNMERNIDLAIRFYHKGSEVGEILCKTQLALLELDKPNNTPIAIASAIETLVFTANMGECHAMLQLGVFYHAGLHDLEEDHVKAAIWYERCISKDKNADLISSARNLSHIYLCGTGGVTKDVKRAFELNELVADSGDAAACYNRFTHYFNGTGVSENNEIAIKSLHESIERGHHEGIETLSFLKKEVKRRIERGDKSEMNKCLAKLLWKK
jgi:TPR repeat protein